MRTPARRTATAALLGVALLSIAACSSEQLHKEDGPSVDGGATAPEATDPEPAGAPAEETTAGEDTLVPEPIEPPEKPAGTRDYPLPVGAELADGDWTVTLGQPHDGWEEIRGSDPYAEQPEDGLEYWLVPVTATYTGEESGSPWLDLQFTFVSTDGRSYADPCWAIVPDDLNEVDDLYTDATVEANACLEVPADPDGLWTVATSWDNPVFFTAEAGGGDA